MYILIICVFMCFYVLPSVIKRKADLWVDHFDEGMMCAHWPLYAVQSHWPAFSKHALWNVFPEMETHFHKLRRFSWCLLLLAACILYGSWPGLARRPRPWTSAQLTGRYGDEISSFCLISTMSPTELTSHWQLENSEGQFFLPIGRVTAQWIKPFNATTPTRKF